LRHPLGKMRIWLIAFCLEGFHFCLGIFIYGVASSTTCVTEAVKVPFGATELSILFGDVSGVPLILVEISRTADPGLFGFFVLEFGLDALCIGAERWSLRLLTAYSSTTTSHGVFNE
jgi:hypothetical protein